MPENETDNFSHFTVKIGTSNLATAKRLSQLFDNDLPSPLLHELSLMIRNCQRSETLEMIDFQMVCDEGENTVEIKWFASEELSTDEDNDG